MATLDSGLGGIASFGENDFSSATKVLGDNDDGAVLVNVTSAFISGINFFGTNYTEIYINSNGAISFGLANNAYDFAGADDFFAPALLPFYSDISIGNGGEIYWDLDPVNGNITITWDAVSPYSGSGSNSFQVVLSDAGGGEMDVEYIYGDMQWGNVGGNAATAGLTDGGANTYELEFSGNSTAMQSYESNDFDNGDPAGIFSTSDSFPYVLIVAGSSGNDILGLGSIDIAGNIISTGNDVILGGAGDDTISTGSAESINWVAFGAGADANGTTGQDFFQYTGSSGSSATIRMNNSPDAGDADSVADYIHVISVDNNVSLMVGDFAVGTDNDALYGGGDADTSELKDSFGSDVVFGGEGGTDSDVINASGMTTGVNVCFTVDEAGQVTSGANTLDFAEVESFDLRAQADTLVGTRTTSGINADGGGDDSFLGGSGNDS